MDAWTAWMWAMIAMVLGCFVLGAREAYLHYTTPFDVPVELVLD